jgi:hypothetical protein
MKNFKKFIPVFLVLSAILFSGCELEKYDLTVKNNTDHKIWVYLASSQSKASDSYFRPLEPSETTTFDSMERNTSYYLQLTSEKIASNQYAVFPKMTINTSYTITVIYDGKNYKF